MSASGLSLAVQIVSTVLLARLLTPADFGVVTMATTFSLILVNFGLNGFTEAIIQFGDLDHQTASNLFWLNSSAGLVLAITFAAMGSLLARLYHNPLVSGVVIGLSAGILIASLSVIHQALLKRAIRFTESSANDFAGRALNTVVSIVLALRGWGYWALVAGIVAQQLSVTVGACWLCPWVPSWPRHTGKTRRMVRFASKVYAQFMFRYATQNADNLLVGWRYNAVALGLYKKAYDLFTISGTQITGPLNNVALATLSRLNDDHDRFRRCLGSSMGMIAFAGLAMSGDLTLVSRDVVRLVLGPNWSESGKIFELFGPGISAMLLGSTVGWIHLSVGKPERWLRWSVLELTVTVSLFLAGLHWGPRGVAAAWSVSYWILVIPAFWYAGRPIGFGISCLVSAVWKYVVAGAAAEVVSAALIRHTPFWATASSTSAALEAVAIASALFLSLYLTFVILLHGGAAPFRQLAGLLRELAPGQKGAEPAVEIVGERGSAGSMFEGMRES
jgi:PST family polysaccharide transporter